MTSAPKDSQGHARRKVSAGAALLADIAAVQPRDGLSAELESDLMRVSNDPLGIFQFLNLRRGSPTESSSATICGNIAAALIKPTVKDKKLQTAAALQRANRGRPIFTPEAAYIAARDARSGPGFAATFEPSDDDVAQALDCRSDRFIGIRVAWTTQIIILWSALTTTLAVTAIAITYQLWQYVFQF
jgi:hypothetical protein